MPLEIKGDFDAEKILSRLGGIFGPGGGGKATAGDDFGREMMNAISRQTLYFIGSIQKKQMSGRRGGIYLNVDTGNLRRSWFPRTWIENGQIMTKAYTNVKYAAIHQYGGTIHRQARQHTLSMGKKGGFVSPSGKAFQTKAQGQRQMRVNVGAYSVRIPKRLFIVEEFEREMPWRYRKAVQEVIRKAVGGG